MANCRKILKLKLSKPIQASTLLSELSTWSSLKFHLKLSWTMINVLSAFFPTRLLAWFNSFGQLIPFLKTALTLQFPLSEHEAPKASALSNSALATSQLKPELTMFMSRARSSLQTMRPRKSSKSKLSKIRNC